MEMISVDLFQVGQCHYLLLMDWFSGFPLLNRLSSLTLWSVIHKLNAWFQLFGYPRIIRSDGGPQFHSEFSSYCDSFNINHEISSPYNHRSNGAAKAGVKNVKGLILRSQPSKFEDNLSIWRSSTNSQGFTRLHCSLAGTFALRFPCCHPTIRLRHAHRRSIALTNTTPFPLDRKSAFCALVPVYGRTRAASSPFVAWVARTTFN